MLMHIAEIYSLNRSSSSLVAIRLIVVNTKYSGILKGSKVGIS
jgi:hypothetical protein